MKRMIAAVLTLLLAVALCACGGEKIPDSPYLGTWTAVSAQFGDADVPIDEVFPGGMVLELQASGVCQLTLGDQSDPASWSAADGNITISDGETDLLGTVDEGAIVLEISGMYITLTRGAEESAGETEEAPAEAEESPAETEEAPAEAEEAPAETEEVPTEAEEAPVEETAEEAA